jgi:thermostable 8-oxoguanine DNA glycosylase
VSTVDTNKLESFIAELERSCPETIRFSAQEFVPNMTLPHDPLIHELVFSLLLWEASLSHAIKAMDAIREQLTDYNELRVCFPAEISSIIGTRYPQSLQRCERISSALNLIFKREQSLSLVGLNDMPKREARQYLASLQGVPGFVAARITLVALGGHAFPIDGLLMKYLTQQGVLEGTATLDQHMSRMERAVRATDSRRLYGMVEYWADSKRNTSSELSTLDVPSAADTATSSSDADS